MEITIVIPSKNTPTLPEALDSVARAAERSPDVSVEIVIVDSSTEPPRIPTEVQRNTRVMVIRKERTLLAARLEGILVARGEWVLNLDADQSIPPELLTRLASSRSAAVVIPEVPPPSPPWDHWVRLVHRIHLHVVAEFRRRPSLAIPVVPRGYRREALMKAVEALLRDVGGNLDRLPSRHEDTILLSYFLTANGLSLPEAIEFADVPISHRVPPLDETARKTVAYGRHLGSETRRMRQGGLTLDSQVWRKMYRVDTRAFEEFLIGRASWEESIYDAFRVCFYFPGFLAGFLGAGRTPTAGVDHRGIE